VSDRPPASLEQLGRGETGGGRGQAWVQVIKGHCRY